MEPMPPGWKKSSMHYFIISNKNLRPQLEIKEIGHGFLVSKFPCIGLKRVTGCGADGQRTFEVVYTLVVGHQFAQTLLFRVESVL